MEPESSFPLYVFDAYGTLFDVHSAVARHRALAGSQAERLSEIWRAKQLEYTWTRSLMGAYRDFDLLTRDALDFAAARCGGLTPEARQTLLSAYETLDAYADAAPALDALRTRGARTVILSNGTPAGLARAVRVWKSFSTSRSRSTPCGFSRPRRPLTVWFASVMACGPGRFPSSRPIAGTWWARPNLAFARSGSTGPALRMNMRICPRSKPSQASRNWAFRQKKRPPEEPAAQV